jgi:hypothetical protein
VAVTAEPTACKVDRWLVQLKPLSQRWCRRGAQGGQAGPLDCHRKRACPGLAEKSRSSCRDRAG